MTAVLPDTYTVRPIRVDDNCGYIGRLAVVPDARGKGLAKFLLYDVFATDAAAGRAGTMLHVDSSNPTPAVGLYTSVGMRPDLISDIWRRTLPTRPIGT